MGRGFTRYESWNPRHEHPSETKSDTMTTLLNEQIDTGDVIEIAIDDDVVSALVLLATDEAVILDSCDGSTPFVLKRDELVEYRKFVPTA